MNFYDVNAAANSFIEDSNDPVTVWWDSQIAPSFETGEFDDES